MGKNILPRDGGRAYAINGSKSVGKPRGKWTLIKDVMKKIVFEKDITLYKADCLEVMPLLPESSIDLVLCDRLPIGLRAPLEASVTLLEATTPVKLPTIQCPPN